MIKPLSFIDERPVLDMMSRAKRKQRSTYRRFVEAGIGDVDAAFINAKKRSPLCIGSDSCRERIESLYETLVDGKARKEDASFRRVGRRCSADDVLSVVCEALGIGRQELLRRRRGSMVRPLAARFLCECSGLTQREVAEVLHLKSGAAVSHQIKWLGEAVGQDASLRRMQRRIARELQEGST